MSSEGSKIASAEIKTTSRNEYVKIDIGMQAETRQLHPGVAGLDDLKMVNLGGRQVYLPRSSQTTDRPAVAGKRGEAARDGWRMRARNEVSVRGDLVLRSGQAVGFAGNELDLGPWPLTSRGFRICTTPSPSISCQAGFMEAALKDDGAGHEGEDDVRVERVS
ncbi:hypothetical protein R3P38DRAFT_2794953 [Favolaschia claudopus]|uniref:Uncharacterized protein n=1 Tax=Favolaschia claudopus TaxID=2862362 RepID=A0AAW0A867_9AGAR